MSKPEQGELYKILHQRETYLSLLVSFLSLALKCARREGKHVGRRNGGRYLVWFLQTFSTSTEGLGRTLKNNLCLVGTRAATTYSALAESAWIPRYKCVVSHSVSGEGEGCNNTCRRGISVSAPVQAPPQLARRGRICIDLVTGESGWALIWEVHLQSSTLIAQGGGGVVNRCQDGNRGETAQLRPRLTLGK